MVEPGAAFDVESEFDEVRLENELQATMERNDQLIKENEMFTAHLFRRKPPPADGQLGPEPVMEGGRRPMTPAEKLEIIMLEEDAINADIAALADQAQRDIISLKEVLEESTVRCNEIKKDAYELRRDLFINAENPKVGEISAERIVKYFQEKLEAKQAQCDKLAAKNNSLKQQIQKCDLQLKQKSEQGENLHQIDFQQLQIENSQYNAKIDQRNKQLLKLKMTTVKTVQILNNGKTDLAGLLNKNTCLKRDIDERKAQIKRMSDELNRVVEDVAKAKKYNKRCEEKLNSMEMPKILDYVHQTSEAQALRAVLQNWKRKVEIAEIGTRRVITARHAQAQQDQVKLKQKVRHDADEAELKAHLEHDLQ
ncbi:Cilia- and flagella-associated protein 263 [Plasmodiophora brassicae]